MDLLIKLIYYILWRHIFHITAPSQDDDLYTIWSPLLLRSNPSRANTPCDEALSSLTRPRKFACAFAPRVNLDIAVFSICEPKRRPLAI